MLARTPRPARLRPWIPTCGSGSPGSPARLAPSGTKRRVRVDLGLEGRRIMVGGASRGLGAAIAEAAAAAGARVAAVARESADRHATAERIGARAAPAALSPPDGRAGAVARALAGRGGLDGLVVNSGGPPPGAFEALDEPAWTRAIEGTLLAAIRGIRAALPA